MVSPALQRRGRTGALFGAPSAQAVSRPRRKSRRPRQRSDRVRQRRQLGSREIRKRTGEARLNFADAAADVHRLRLRVELEAVFEEREIIVRTKTGCRRAGQELRKL